MSSISGRPAFSLSFHTQLPPKNTTPDAELGSVGTHQHWLNCLQLAGRLAWLSLPRAKPSTFEWEELPAKPCCRPGYAPSPSLCRSGPGFPMYAAGKSTPQQLALSSYSLLIPQVPSKKHHRCKGWLTLHLGPELIETQQLETELDDCCHPLPTQHLEEQVTIPWTF